MVFGIMKDPQYMKKGNIDSSVSSIVILITGVGVAVLVLIFVGALGGQTYNIVETDIENIYTVTTNKSFTAVNGTAVSISDSAINSGSLSIIDENSTAIGLGNFSIDYQAGDVTLTSGAAYNNLPLNASFTSGDLTIENSVKGSITSGFSALEQTGDYLPIIVLAVVIVMVLGLVVGFAAMGGGKSGGSGAL